MKMKMGYGKKMGSGKKGADKAENLHENVQKTSGGKATKGYGEMEGVHGNGPGGHVFGAKVSNAAKEQGSAKHTAMPEELQHGHRVLEKNAGTAASKDHSAGEYKYAKGEIKNDSDTEMEVSKKKKGY